jgi:hypothetical protein
VNERRTSDETLISAVRILARDIQSEDACTNACLLEVAERLEELVKERLTPEERDAVSGIALVLDRLKLYPEQVGRTKRDDLDLLWRISGANVKEDER